MVMELACPELRGAEIDGSELGICAQKLEIPSTKLQINLKLQYPMTKPFRRDIFCIFEFRSLEII